MTRPDRPEPPNIDNPDAPDFDAVAMQRAIRERMSQETAGMSFDEMQRYLREHTTIPLAPAPTQSAA